LAGSVQAQLAAPPHDNVQPPPLQSTFVPATPAMEQLPPAQLNEHVAPALHVNEQPPAGQSSEQSCLHTHCVPPLQVFCAETSASSVLHASGAPRSASEAATAEAVRRERRARETR
jgi:hypothetical protein